MEPEHYIKTGGIIVHLVLNGTEFAEARNCLEYDGDYYYDRRNFLCFKKIDEDTFKDIDSGMLWKLFYEENLEEGHIIYNQGAMEDIAVAEGWIKCEK